MTEDFIKKKKKFKPRKVRKLCKKLLRNKLPTQVFSRETKDVCVSGPRKKNCVKAPRPQYVTRVWPKTCKIAHFKIKYGYNCNIKSKRRRE